MKSRSQWPRDVMHELSSPALTLKSWVRTPLEASISEFVLSFVGSGLVTGWPPSEESYQFSARFIVSD
jgi:hypothetical protein